MDPNTPAPPPPPAAYPPPPPPPPPVAPAPVAAVQPVIVERKSPGLAGFLSVFPGLGHLYLGLYQRAFAFAGAFCVLIFFNSHGRMAVLSGPAAVRALGRSAADITSRRSARRTVRDRRCRR